MLLEVCSGCDYAARTGLWASGLCCAALSVQGASVLLQVRTLCPPEVSFKPLLWRRGCCTCRSRWRYFIWGLPQDAVESFNTLCSRVVSMRRVPTDCALLAVRGVLHNSLRGRLQTAAKCGNITLGYHLNTQTQRRRE